jgi:hypothetical protein
LPAREGPSERARKHRWRVAWLVGIVVLAVVIVADVLSSRSGSDQTAAQSSAPGVSDDGASTDATTIASNPGSMPASAGDLVYLDTAQAEAAVARVRQNIDAVAGGVFSNALMGAYGPTANGDYTMISVFQPLSNLSAADQSKITSQSPQDFVSQMANVLHDPTAEATSDPSAAMSCGTIVAGATFVMCVWDDSHAFGADYFYGGTSEDDAALDTDLLRVSTEALN